MSLPAERHQVVRHLATVEGMADRKIALHLRWGRDWSGVAA